MSELHEALDRIKKQELVLEAIYTHHRSADELSSEWFWQKENFKQVKKGALSFGYSNLRFHSSNSASLFRHSDFNEDMARIGIAAYGCLQLPKSFGDLNLKPILSLYANKVSSREVKKRAECWLWSYIHG
jgi:alanine racemase